MKKIQKISALLLAAFMLLQVQWLFAQRNHPGHRASQIPLEEMKTQLELTDQQVAQLESISKTYAEKRKALREEPSGDREAMKNLMQAQRKEVSEVLTPDQQVKLAELKKERSGERRQKRGERRHNDGDKKALNTALKTYHEENIQPLMRSQRIKLDDKMSTGDKTALAELRTQLQDWRMEQKAAMKAHQKARKDGTSINKEELKAAKTTARATHQQYMEKAKGLANKYDEAISELLAEIAPQKEKWAADVKAIKEKYLGDEKGKKHRSRKQSHRGDGPSGLAPEQRREMAAAKKEQHEKIKFLLLDVESTKPITRIANIDKIRIFPNPSNIDHTLSFELKQAGKVKIVLIDRQGKVVRSIIDEQREAGAYEEKINLSSLKGQVFYYRIDDGSGTVISEKFVLLRE